MLNKEMKDLAPQVYFGGEEPPDYFHLDVGPSGSIESIISSIRAIGGGCDSSGYIDEEGIHFHIPRGEEIHVDLSKPMVFVSQPAVTDGDRPSSWQVFSFLRESAMQALFIGSEDAILIEKTVLTLKLCEALDRLWAQERFLTATIKMIESEKVCERVLPHLMKTYEDETHGSTSEMWNFWDSFSEFLMERRLGLMVNRIL